MRASHPVFLLFSTSVLFLVSACSESPRIRSATETQGAGASGSQVEVPIKIIPGIVTRAGGTATPPSPSPGVNLADLDGNVILNNESQTTQFKGVGSVIERSGSSVTKPYRITIGGTEAVTIYGIQNTHQDAKNKITVTASSLPVTIPAGGTLDFSLGLDSSLNNTHLGRIEIFSSDPVQSNPTLEYGFNMATRSLVISFNNAHPNTSHLLLVTYELGKPFESAGVVMTADQDGYAKTEVLADKPMAFFKVTPAVKRFAFNVAGAVGTAPSLSCAGDSDAPSWSDCTSQPNGRLCGRSSKGRVKVCNTGQCVLFGDLNYDDDVNFLDTEGVVAELTQYQSNLAANFTCDGSFSDIDAQYRGFANLLAAGLNIEEYNSRVRSACGGDVGLTQGRAKVFLGSPMNWTNYQFNTPVEVCVDNLGDYDPNTGDRVNPPNGFLNGKFIKTLSDSINNPGSGFPPTSSLYSSSGDFRVNFDGSLSASVRDALMWSSEAQLYYDINRYRSLFLNEAFVEQLSLPVEIQNNLLRRQYRSDLSMAAPQRAAKPVIYATEAVNPQGLALFPEDNTESVPLRTRGPYSNYASLPPLSAAFDAGMAVGDYAGLVAFWVLGTNLGFPPDGFWGASGWQNNILPPINDGISGWSAYRYTGETEIYKYLYYSQRTWAGRICGGTNIPCNKGVNIRNVMMFDEANLTADGVFPYSRPSGLAGQDGPSGSDLASAFFAALYYDISHEAGLGDYKADLLFWKSISLITNNSTFTMRDYGAKIIEAAQALWGGLYDQDISNVLTSRGIPLNGLPDFRSNLPAAIGVYPTSLEVNSASGFGSSHPDSQPNVNSYGIKNFFSNGYIQPGASPQDYVAYQFYKHSKYGPCDKLVLTNGTFNSSTGNYNNDGTYYRELTDRSLGNLTVLAPGNRIRWNRIRMRCANEATGFYAEDVRPFGFRVVKAITNGFSFTVSPGAMSGDLRKYSLKIVDPSVTRLGAATYNWTVTDHLGIQTTATGEEVEITVPVDLPFTLSIDRTRGAQTDNLSLRERGSDLDRSSGNAFVLNLIP